MSTQEKTNGAEVAQLGLGSVLVGSLPATLLTDGAPDRYTVEAVFTRRPDPDEIKDILGSDTRQFLTRAGYSTVEVTISDRRLEIANTNLEELRDGLAGLLSERLAAISADVHARRQAAAAQFEIAAEHEQERAAAVAALAESVVFASAHPGTLRTRSARSSQE
ncbi:hypothetical protein [Microbacterium sp. SSM24]|uniref:hypothetical protein n=1 Tax=Microbacterium sp. SSM24 TaxID=2991714 RepID=UPI002227D172|nr:hypothetical protein [Microbacterium sp. SSM24]MCW3492105.1 hypothetical protein [Microbacterium sp. SSM24]